MLRSSCSQAATASALGQPKRRASCIGEECGCHSQNFAASLARAASGEICCAAAARRRPRLQLWASRKDALVASARSADAIRRISRLVWRAQLLVRYAAQQLLAGGHGFSFGPAEKTR